MNLMKSYESYEKKVSWIRTTQDNVVATSKMNFFEKTGPQVKNHNFLYFMTISHNFALIVET